MTAVCGIIATVIGAGFVIGLIDYLIRFHDPGLRIIATAAFAIAVSWAVYRWILSPGRGRFVPLFVAQRIEAHFPDLNDSLSSAIEFLHQSETDAMAGSAQLRRLVISEAQQSIESLPLDDVIDRRPLRKAAAWVAAMALLGITCFVVNPGASSTAVARLILPLGNIQWPRQNHLAFRNVPTQLAAGQPFEVELVDENGRLPNDATIEYASLHDGKRDVVAEPMVRIGDKMIARRDNVNQPFAFRATGGDDDTMPWQHVEVRELPHLESMRIVVHPPAYTGFPASATGRQIHVLAGTGIEISGTTTEPIRGARLLPPCRKPIDASIGRDAAGRDACAFRIEPAKWIATESGPYKLELVSEAGLSGVVAQGILHVDQDSPPTVAWQMPADDPYVLPSAVLPVEVVVQDDVAIRSVDLTYERNDKSENERVAHPKEPPISLYLGPPKPQPAASGSHSPSGERRVISYSWQLASLNLVPGSILTVSAEASDYRPAIGRTIGPRRVLIINVNELEARLANRQLQIARQLERALAIQRKTRDDVHQLTIQLRDADQLHPRDRDTLLAAEPNQRSVGRILMDPAEGVPPMIDAILREIEINRLATGEIGETMTRLRDELRRLTAGPLDVAQRELTSARKTVESAPSNSNDAENKSLNIPQQQLDAISRSLVSASASQDELIQSLEKIVAELSGKTDYRRLIRQLAELVEEQQAHAKSARTDISVDSLPLEVSELTRSQRATLDRTSASETELAVRYAKIEESIDELARQLTRENDSMAGKLTDAVDLSQRLAIRTSMEQVAADFATNRVGRALGIENKVIDGLKQVLKLLRNEGPQSAEQTIDQLKQAEQRLADLQKQLAELRQQVAQAERAVTSATARNLEQLNNRQQSLKTEIEKLARQLDRVQAAEASKSAQSAAAQLSNSNPNSNQQLQAPAQPRASSNQIQKAEEQLQQAAEQLAARRRQAEDDLATEFVRRFQTDLTQMVQRQNRVVRRTKETDATRKPGTDLSPDQIKVTSDLAGEEQELAQIATEHSQLLTGLGAVRVSLEEASHRLDAAGKQLADRQTGPPAQEAEQLALSRLEGMLQAFAQTANEAAPKPTADHPPQGAANNQPPQQQRRPTFELLEVKMLRMLQADLNERTRQHEQRMAAAAGNAAETAALEKEARDLSAEQGQLAELVEKMVKRDNKPEDR